MALAHALVVAAISTALQQGAIDQPELISLLDAGNDTVLRLEIRARPNDARAAVAELMRLAVRAQRAEDRVRRLLQAEQLAQLYAGAWSDSFFISTVEQFKAWTADERIEKLEADSVRGAGRTAFSQQGPEAAIRLWEQSLSVYRGLSDLPGQAAALGNMGSGHYAMGQLDRALSYYARSLELAEAAGDHRTRGNALGNIAAVHRDRGDLSLASEFYAQAVEIRPLTGDSRGEAADLNNLGLVSDELGDLAGAEEYFLGALEQNRSAGRPRSAATNLTNLGNVATKRGRYSRAYDLYTEALGTRRETGDRRGEAHDLRNIGLLHLRWGDYSAALSSLKAALAVLEEIGPPIRRALVMSDIAAVQAGMGQLNSALEHIERARAEVAGDGGGWELEPDLALQQADLLAQLNDFEAATDLYRDVIAAYKEIEYPSGQAEAEQGLGSLHLALEQYDLAEEALSRAYLIQESFADARPAALTQALLGDVQLQRGDSAAARESYLAALAVHRSLGDAAAEAVTLGALADLDRSLGDLETAAAGYNAALALLEGRAAPTVEWALHVGLGLTLRDKSQLAAAASELREAILQLEAIGGTLPVEERRYGYLEDKWSVHAELVLTELARGRSEAAFEASEKMRARQMIDLLARGRTHSGTLDEALVRDEQTLRRRIGQLSRALYLPGPRTNMIRGPTAVADPRLDEVRESLAAAQTQYQRLLVDLKASSPEYASLVSGSTVGVADLQRLLPPGAVFIEYLFSDVASVAFVVSRADVAAVELPINRKELRQLVEFHRGTIGRPGSLGSADNLWRAPLRRLYQAVLAPIEEAGHLNGRRRLIIAPHAELHYVPFQALLKPAPGGERFLIESFDVAYVPSASVWVFLSERERPTPRRGILAMAPRPRSLVASADEVRTLSRSERGVELLVGSRATESRFFEVAPEYRVIHLATYGVLNTVNPLFSFVELNPGRDSDGRLEVHEIFGLRLAADLVVLSACETALGSGFRQDVPPGDDWVGLVRAFLYAGAQSVVASQWRVDDRSTAVLMEHFYRSMRGGSSIDAALADAQRALIRDGDYANPFYWAAFVSVGNVQ